MAPPKVLRTRSNIANDCNTLNNGPNGNAFVELTKKATKRKADASPVRNDKVKRYALGNLTNAVSVKDNNHPVKNNNVAVAAAATRKPRDVHAVRKPLRAVQSNNENVVFEVPTAAAANNKKQQQQQALKAQSIVDDKLLITTSVTNNSKAAKALVKEQQVAPRRTKVLTRAAARANQPELDNTVKPTEPATSNLHVAVPDKPRRRISNEFEQTKTDDDSMYLSALEESTDFRRLSSGWTDQTAKSGSSNTISSATDITMDTSCDGTTVRHVTLLSTDDVIATSRPPPDVHDFDLENWNDPFQASHYAMDIFNYLKMREEHFPVRGYMNEQKHISRWMRSLLIDWMVEVQETFELNHETLYLAVKIVDQYLGKQIIIKDKLQLLGAAALFLACKYDERTPPMIDDFLYICDGAYVQKELISMEMDVFRTIDYNLGIPLSYRFLRRYARCAKIPMTILTLARYILEFSLMDYATVTLRDSKLASAALFIALRMNNEVGWTPTLEYYTGYSLKEFASVAVLMNMNIHQKPRDAIKTVRNKYTHKIFFEVAKTPLYSTERLFENTGVCYPDHISSV